MFGIGIITTVRILPIENISVQTLKNSMLVYWKIDLGNVSEIGMQQLENWLWKCVWNRDATTLRGFSTEKSFVYTKKYQVNLLENLKNNYFVSLTIMKIRFRLLTKLKSFADRDTVECYNAKRKKKYCCWKSFSA